MLEICETNNHNVNSVVWCCSARTQGTMTPFNVVLVDAFSLCRLLHGAHHLH